MFNVFFENIIVCNKRRTAPPPTTVTIDIINKGDARKLRTMILVQYNYRILRKNILSKPTEQEQSTATYQ